MPRKLDQFFLKETRRMKARASVWGDELLGPDQNLGVSAVPGIENQSGPWALEVGDRDAVCRLNEKLRSPSPGGPRHEMQQPEREIGHEQGGRHARRR